MDFLFTFSPVFIFLSNIIQMTQCCFRESSSGFCFPFAFPNFDPDDHWHHCNKFGSAYVLLPHLNYRYKPADSTRPFSFDFLKFTQSFKGDLSDEFCCWFKMGGNLERGDEDLNGWSDWGWSNNVGLFSTGLHLRYRGIIAERAQWRIGWFWWREVKAIYWNAGFYIATSDFFEFAEKKLLYRLLF